MLQLRLFLRKGRRDGRVIGRWTKIDMNATVNQVTIATTELRQSLVTTVTAGYR